MNKQALIEFTQRLVRQQSLSGEEGPVTQIIVDEMQSLGFDKVWVDVNGSAIGTIEGKLQFMLTVVFAFILYANGEQTAQRVRMFGRRLAGPWGEHSVAS